jgi:hypothetical protein
MSRRVARVEGKPDAAREDFQQIGELQQAGDVGCAGQLADVNCRSIMLRIAGEYDRLAQQAGQTLPTDHPENVRHPATVILD